MIVNLIWNYELGGIKVQEGSWNVGNLGVLARLCQERNWGFYKASRFALSKPRFLG